MQTSTPRVSIGIPVYNGGQMFADLLDSLVRQSFTDFEIVISDNASTDTTSKIAQDYAEKDLRIRYYRNKENIGAAPNYNRVFELASPSPYFKWAAHDDIYAPTFLEKCVQALDSDPDVVLAYTIVDVIDESEQNSLSQHESYARGVVESYTTSDNRQGWMMGPLHLGETTDPAERYSEVLNRMIACFPIFGLIRREAIEKSTMHLSYYGSDRSLLAQFVLMGRFCQIHERLYTNRYHKTVSRLLSAKEQKSWIDPKAGSGVPMLKQKRDLLRAPFIAGLGPLDATRCVAVVLKHILRREAGKIIKPIFGWS